MVNASIMGTADFLYDILRSAPNGDSFLWLNAKFTTTLVAHTSLVHFYFIGERPRLFLCSQIRMVHDCLAAGSGLGPSSPLLRRSSGMLPFTVFEKSIQRGVGVLHCQEEVGS